MGQRCHFQNHHATSHTMRPMCPMHPSRLHPTGRAQEDIAVGTLTFADGSIYNGTLKHGIPDGLGTCTWKDGNKYDGEWRSGLMHGFGTFLWTSGQRYDGEWKVRHEGGGLGVLQGWGQQS